jgi:hypothetical protein
MAAGATLREYFLAAIENRLVAGQKGVASRGVRQSVGPCRLKEEQGSERGLRFRCLPVARVLLGDRDLDRRDRRAADNRIEVTGPFLAVKTDVQIHPVESPQSADRIGAVLENARRENYVPRLK